MHHIKYSLFTTIIAITFPSIAAAQNIIPIPYEGFTVWVDCDRQGPVLFHYIAEADSGNFERHDGYKTDPNVDPSCQSLRNASFQSTLGLSDTPYDVGHMVPANHFDGSELAIKQTNFWTNLLPQTSSMNRGAWLHTEKITECLREETPIEVWGGPIWGSNFDDNQFIDTHGIATPAAFWKILIRTDNRDAIAWVIPNASAPQSSVDDWLQSPALIEILTGREFDVADKNFVPETSWTFDGMGCDLS